MPRTMLKDNHWTRLISILLELNLYDKGNLRQTAEGVVYQMIFGRPWHDLPSPYFGKHYTVYKDYQLWFRKWRILEPPDYIGYLA